MTAACATATDDYLDEDLPCSQCGYNLRGAPRAGRCPECGEPVAVALAWRLAGCGDLRWLNQLDRAGLVFAAALAVEGLTGVVAILAYALTDVGGYVLVIGHVCAAAVALLSCWLGAAGMGARSKLEGCFSWRRAVRVCVIVAAAILALIVARSFRLTAVPPINLDVVLLGLGFATVLTGGVAQIEYEALVRRSMGLEEGRTPCRVRLAVYFGSWAALVSYWIAMRVISLDFRGWFVFDLIAVFAALVLLGSGGRAMAAPILLRGHVLALKLRRESILEQWSRERRCRS